MAKRETKRKTRSGLSDVRDEQKQQAVGNEKIHREEEIFFPIHFIGSLLTYLIKTLASAVGKQRTAPAPGSAPSEKKEEGERRDEK